MHSAARCHSLRVALRFPDPTLVTGRDANARQANSSVLGGFRECRRVVALCCLCRSSLLKFGIQKCRVLSAAHGCVCTRVVCCVSCCVVCVVLSHLASSCVVSCRVVSCRVVSLCRVVVCRVVISRLLSFPLVSSPLSSSHHTSEMPCSLCVALQSCCVSCCLISPRRVSCRVVVCCVVISRLLSFPFVSSPLFSSHHTSILALIHSCFDGRCNGALQEQGQSSLIWTP